MVTTLQEMGVTMEKHHHEVAPSQHELGIKFETFVRSADNVQAYKYAVAMVAHIYGKTATFMPKPVIGDNGTGICTRINPFGVTANQRLLALRVRRPLGDRAALYWRHYQTMRRRLMPFPIHQPTATNA